MVGPRAATLNQIASQAGITLGTGQALVQGSTSNTLSAVPGKVDKSQYSIQAQVVSLFGDPGRVFVNVGKGIDKRFTAHG